MFSVSEGITLGLTGLFSGVLAYSQAQTRQVMAVMTNELLSMRKHVTNLESNIANCQQDRSKQNLLIGRLEATVEHLKHEIEFNVERRRFPYQPQPKPKA